MQLLRRKWVRLIIALVAFAALLWLSGIRVFAFPGQSMSPAVAAGDHFVGMIGVWGLRSPGRFDMVIFHVPSSSRWAGHNIPWMKRLVGLPREHVRLSGNELYIDGHKVDAPFLHSDGQATSHHDCELMLGDEEYFVLGDNLDYSFEDSRSMGPINRSLIRGFVAYIFRGGKK
jgi:signal peptidase I